MSISTTWRMALVGVGFAYEKLMLEVHGRFLAVRCHFLHIAGEQNNNAVLTWSQMINSVLVKIFLMYLFKSPACNAGHCLGKYR